MKPGLLQKNKKTKQTSNMFNDISMITSMITFMNNDKENYAAIFIEIIFPRLFSDIKQYYRFQLTGNKCF